MVYPFFWLGSQGYEDLFYKTRIPQPKYKLVDKDTIEIEMIPHVPLPIQTRHPEIGQIKNSKAEVTPILKA